MSPVPLSRISIQYTLTRNAYIAFRCTPRYKTVENFTNQSQVENTSKSFALSTFPSYGNKVFARFKVLERVLQ